MSIFIIEVILIEIWCCFLWYSPMICSKKCWVWVLYKIIIFRCEMWMWDMKNLMWIWMCICRWICWEISNRWKCWFSLGFCIYIGRKWFGLWGGIWVVEWVKVLILVGFYDIGCDIGIWEDKLMKCLILLDFVGFCFNAWKLSWCVDNPAYRLL